MDKKTVLLASACTLLMISCSNDAELINVAETTGLQTKAFVGEADFQIVDYAGDKCMTCPKIALHSNNYKKCTSYD